MSIEVLNITKEYGSQKALDAVSFSVGQGSITGFLGPNGAGKSTMMKILTCFIPQNSGIAKICGFDVYENSYEVKQQVGYLPEHNPLYLDMYVKEYLSFAAGVHKLKNVDKRVAQMVEITGLTLEQKKKIGALSKGYRQRVGLAQALIHDPKVLILDEPTTGLDPNQLVEIRTLIKELGKEKTVLFSTHILQEVKAVCDNIIIINKGKIVANSDAKTMQSDDKNQTTLILELDKEIDPSKLKNIDGIITVQKSSDLKWKITFNKDNDIRQAVMQMAISNQLTILSMKIEEQSLEDIFQKLTN
ncbi:MAG TPA: gliding motility-associated ABC transporter ATP-binding subunit GldA [Bacteroidia bacterium]|nr:gliding motility-associated ABC transporter ATP-binding subunit GldA [Bacteroidia bacterium]